MRFLLPLLAACQLADSVIWTSVSSIDQMPPNQKKFNSIYKPDSDNDFNKPTCRWMAASQVKPGHVYERKCDICEGGRKSTGYPYDVLSYEPSTEDMYWKNKASTSETRTKGIQVGRSVYFVCALNTYGPGVLNVDSGLCYTAGYKSEVETYSMGGPRSHGLLVNPAIRYHVSDVHFNMEDIEEVGSYSKNGAVVEHTNAKERSETVVLTPRLAMTMESSFEMDQYYYADTDMRVMAGAPVYSNGQWETSAEQTQEVKYGQTQTSMVEFGANIQVEIPPRSTCSVRLFGLQKRVNVRYTAHVNNTFEDGHQVEGDVSGLYRGLPVDKVTAEDIRCQNIDSGDLSVPLYKTLSTF